MTEKLYYSIPNDQILVLDADGHLYSEHLRVLNYYGLPGLGAFLEENKIVYIGDL